MRMQIEFDMVRLVLYLISTSMIVLVLDQWLGLALQHTFLKFWGGFWSFAAFPLIGAKIRRVS